MDPPSFVDPVDPMSRDTALNATSDDVGMSPWKATEERELDDAEHTQIESQLSTLKDSLFLTLANYRTRCDSRADLQREQDNQAAQQKMAHLRDRLQAKNNENDRLRAELSSMRELHKITASDLSKTEGRLCKFIRENFFRLWKTAKRDHEHRIRIMEKWSGKRSKGSIAKIFRGWRKRAHDRAQGRHENKLTKSWEDKMRAVIQEYENKIRELSASNALLDNNLRSSEEGRIKAEQRMKQAFMRSVSALNLEAMTYFRTEPPA